MVQRGLEPVEQPRRLVALSAAEHRLGGQRKHDSLPKPDNDCKAGPLLQRRQRPEHRIPVASHPGQLSGGDAGVVEAHRERARLRCRLGGVHVLGGRLPVSLHRVELTGHGMDERQIPGSIAVLAE